MTAVQTMDRGASLAVMVGLVPTIHALRRWGQATRDHEARNQSIPRKGVDGRHKGDHDGGAFGP